MFRSAAYAPTHYRLISNVPTPTQSELALRHRRISRALYRQLLRWCSTVQQQGFPDSVLQSFLPPLHSTAPEEIDPYRTELLYEISSNADDIQNHSNDAIVARRAYGMLPEETQFARKHITFTMHSLEDLKNSIRAIFRLNNVEMPDPHEDTVSFTMLQEYQKSRRNAAFESLKNLNELLADDLEEIQKLRMQHMDREHVQFRLGQVVQHHQERWRGVVVGWEKRTSSPSGSGKLSQNFATSSLTKKSYDLSGDPSNPLANVQIHILQDIGDIASLKSTTGWITAEQTELEPVKDRRLCRIRNSFTEGFFSAFNTADCRFMPKPIRTFEYPVDNMGLDNVRDSSDYRQLCDDIKCGVQQFAADLESDLASELAQLAGTHAVTSRMLNDFREQLHRLSLGNVGSVSRRSGGKSTSKSSVAIHMRELLNVSHSVLEIMALRRTSLREGHKMRFSVGDVVQHKKFNFRGVVVARDPLPTVNVSRWDGLKDIANPMQLPFYQVIMDQDDCIEAFGGRRPLRYVCEENLKPCPRDRASLEVDLDPGWGWDAGTYVPPNLVRFQYGSELGDDGVFERCMTTLEGKLNRWQYLARSPNVEDSNIHKISLTNMLRLLQSVDTLDDALVVQEAVKEIHKAHISIDLRSRLEKGTGLLVAGNLKSAYDTYQAIVHEDPMYVEGWNKLATCEYMMGRYAESIRSSMRALELEPLHHQAMSGMGLIFMEKEEYNVAGEWFQKSLDIDPWSPISTKLSHCVDMSYIESEEGQTP